MYINLSIDEGFKEYKKEKNAILLDVRHIDEYQRGHLEDAINYDNDDIDSNIKKFLPDLNQKIYIYCRSGRRSKEASLKLLNLGYTNLIEIGGLLDYHGKLVK